jgi:ssDNA-binding Zn-finger/Zn-ribbon topoisomerase 1
MQVICPECGKVGLLQTITPGYHRIRHSIVTKCYGTCNGRPYNNRTFNYCRVSIEWAEEQINAEKKREEAELRRILGNECYNRMFGTQL